MHGAGVIEKIENKTILGEKREYYVLKVPTGDMKVMIPVNQADTIGVRNVIEGDQLDKVVEILHAPSSSMPTNWNRRYRANMDKLKTGDIKEVAEVVRNLQRTDLKKHLSTGEKKLLTNARHILMSEIVLATDMEPDAADKLIDEAVTA